jgi:hypothetical protein
MLMIKEDVPDVHHGFFSVLIFHITVQIYNAVLMEHKHVLCRFHHKGRKSLERVLMIYRSGLWFVRSRI